MKIELKYNGKNLTDPDFTLLYNNEKDSFAIAVNYDDSEDYENIRQDIMSSFENHEIKGTSFYYYTKDNVYMFNLEEGFEIIPINKPFSHCVVLLDKNDKIVEKQYKKFDSILTV